MIRDRNGHNMSRIFLAERQYGLYGTEYDGACPESGVSRTRMKYARHFLTLRWTEKRYYETALSLH